MLNQEKVKVFFTKNEKKKIILWLTETYQEMAKKFGQEYIPCCIQESNRCILNELLEKLKSNGVK